VSYPKQLEKVIVRFQNPNRTWSVEAYPAEHLEIMEQWYSDRKIDGKVKQFHIMVTPYWEDYLRSPFSALNRK
jgi:hypothetical protein